MKIPNQIRFINKRFTNRLMMKIAGKKRSFVALIRHAGRRSGKLYKTPILAAPVPGGFVFALTYGTVVDWYQNILASGRATLVYHNESFKLTNPVVLPASEGRQAFTLPKNTF
jgi:deazaflavin-dependent oxidoreductase (nitroreductase family)